MIIIYPVSPLPLPTYHPPSPPPLLPRNADIIPPSASTATDDDDVDNNADLLDNNDDGDAEDGVSSSCEHNYYATNPEVGSRRGHFPATSPASDNEGEEDDNDNGDNNALRRQRQISFSFSFSSRWHRRARKGPYALRPVSQQSPQGCPRNSANIHLVEHRSFSTLEGGMSAASFLHSSFLRAISATMLWPVHVQEVPQASEHL